MARLDEESSYETMLDYCAQVGAGLGALDELNALRAPFVDLTGRIQKARDNRDAARWSLLGKSARVRVFDARWDGSVKALSGQAFLLANKDSSKDPYNALFGTVTAEDAVALGPSKAEAFGNQVLAKGQALANGVLDPLLGTLKTAQQHLMAADTERDQAGVEALTHELERRKLLRALEAAADMAEVGILTRFPGDKTLTRAILVAERSRKKPKADAPA